VVICMLEGDDLIGTAVRLQWRSVGGRSRRPGYASAPQLVADARAAAHSTLITATVLVSNAWIPISCGIACKCARSAGSLAFKIANN